MKKYIMLLLLAVATLGASAQSTRVVSGAVIDKNGNPLPGATVSATGGAETTLTQSDGTFSLEVPIWLKSLTASYAGMDDKKLRTDFNRDMIFTMKPSFNRAWFINLTGGYSIADFNFGNIGVMAGRYGKWGYYAKVTLPLHARISYSYGMQGIVGGIKSISDRVYFYLGVGYGAMRIEADRTYIFFSRELADEAVAPHVARIKMNSRSDADVNRLYLVFSPNEFAKVADTNSSAPGAVAYDRRGNAIDLLPRQTDFARFQKWLARSRRHDPDMQVLQAAFSIEKR